ncbi:MAG: SulP family inorganic anion transporter [Cytophagales bacterium]
MGWKYFFNKDFKAALVVALVSLPLSVGLSVACGFPPFAGVLSSIIGGVLLSFFTGSEIAIKAPASGLGAITLASVYVLGNGDMALGYKYTLAVIVISGVLQVISGLIRMGSLVYFFPSAVIHGMMASLGFIMFAKQIPIVLGEKLESKSSLNILMEVPEMILNANPKIAILGLGTFLFVILYVLLFKKIEKIVPPLVPLLMIGVPLAIIFDVHRIHQFSFWGLDYTHNPDKFLLHIPDTFPFGLHLPNFSKVQDISFWFFVLMFFVACNIESILTCKLIEQEDEKHRQTHYNKDLISIGFGNMLCGFLGGLPLISESKRSNVALHNGSQSIITNFLQGLFIFLLMWLVLPILNFLPLSMLAAYLMFLGLKMTLPTEFSKSYKIGKEQLLVFSVVFGLTISFNFLIGVCVGTILELLIHIKSSSNFKDFFVFNADVERPKDHEYCIRVKGPALFSNYISAKRILLKIPNSAKLTIDFADASVVDHSFMENLSVFDLNRKINGSALVIKGLEFHTQVSEHPLATRIKANEEENLRKKDLLKYAIESGMTYKPFATVADENSLLFTLKSKWRVLGFENVLDCKIGDSSVFFTDLIIESKGVNVNRNKVTVLVMDGFSKSVPDFVLQQDGFDEGLFGVELGADINFEEYPSFSHYYYLTGANENAVREFFGSRVIMKLFKNHQSYHILLENGKLIMYKKTTLASVEDMEKMVSFTLDFFEAAQSTLYQKSEQKGYQNLF